VLLTSPLTPRAARPFRRPVRPPRATAELPHARGGEGAGPHLVAGREATSPSRGRACVSCPPRHPQPQPRSKDGEKKHAVQNAPPPPARDVLRAQNHPDRRAAADAAQQPAMAATSSSPLTTLHSSSSFLSAPSPPCNVAAPPRRRRVPYPRIRAIDLDQNTVHEGEHCIAHGISQCLPTQINHACLISFLVAPSRLWPYRWASSASPSG